MVVPTLVFSHRVSGSGNASEYFANASEALSSPYGDVTQSVHKYSILSTLDQRMRWDGRFEFKLYYPLISSTAVNHWVQGTNPNIVPGVSGWLLPPVPGFQPIRLDYTGEVGGCSEFEGLEQDNLNCGLLKGSPSCDFWFFSIGTYASCSPWLQWVGFPGPSGSATFVQLWVLQMPSPPPPSPSPPT
jgi:hypothetical protein